MDANKRKRIEAKLNQLFSQATSNPPAERAAPAVPSVVKVIRRRKGRPDRKVA